MLTRVFKRWMHRPNALQRLIIVVASAGSALLLASAGHGQQHSFRATTEVPQTWIAYAGALRGKAEAILRSEDPVARRLHSALVRYREINADQPPLQVTVRVWIGADGQVTRATFNPVSNSVDGDLRALLLHIAAGSPPDGMLQPVHLKLSLEPRK